MTTALRRSFANLLGLSLLLMLLVACEQGTSTSAALEAPVGLNATVGDDAIKLEWTAQTSGSTTFNVYRSFGTEVQPIAQYLIAASVPSTIYVDGDQFEPGSYAYTVTAQRAGRESVQSDEATVTLTTSLGFPEFSEIEWSDVTPAPIGRLEAQGGIWNGDIYVFGGFVSWDPYRTTTDSHRYDPESDTWTQLADIPEAWTHAGTVIDGDDIYFAGGWTNPNDRSFDDSDTIYEGEATVLRYHVPTDTWHVDAPPLPEGRGAGGFAKLGRNLHFFGGHERRLAKDSHVDVGTHWVLSLDDLASGWNELAPMPNPRNHFGSLAHGGYLYAIGGQHLYEYSAVTQTDVHRYDPATDSWTQMAGLPFPISHNSGATFSVGERIFVLGGEIDHNDYLDTALIYDPETDTWSRSTDLPLAANAAIAGFAEGQLYFTGGGGFFGRHTFRGATAQ